MMQGEAMDRKRMKTLSIIGVALVLLQCSGGWALRFQIPEEEMDLHPNELSVIEPGSLAVHPDMATIGNQATLSLNVTSAIADGDFVAVSVQSSKEASLGLFDSSWGILVLGGGRLHRSRGALGLGRLARWYEEDWQ